MADGFVRVKKSIIENKNLSVYERMILFIFIDRQELALSIGEDSFFCYVDWLADTLNVSVRTIKTAIKNLKQLGYINIEKRKYKVGKRNYYSVNKELLV